MSEPIKGKLDIQNTAGTSTTITLNGDAGDLTVGGLGQMGDLILRDTLNKERVRLGRVKELVVTSGDPSPNLVADYVGLRLADADGQAFAQLGRVSSRTAKPEDVSFVFGGGKLAGHLSVVSALQKETIHLDGGTSSLVIKNADQEVIQLQLAFTSDPIFPGGPPAPELGGRLTLTNAAGQTRVTLDGSRADAHIGGVGRAGDLFVRRLDGSTAIHVDGQQGAIACFAKGGSNETLNQPRIQLHGETGGLALMVKPNGAGAIVLKNNSLKEIIRLDSVLSPIPGSDQIAIDEGGRIVVKTFSGVDSIVMDGTRGDIILKNADCAEDFDVAQSAEVDPGTVVVIDQDGTLRPSQQPYDKKVAGVISGGGNCRPGLVLDKQDSQPDRLPVALLGKVYCKADARYAPIETGDLLTTSPTPGHAMRADDPLRAFGAVIGKAMRPLATGQGLIPILIALQ